MMVEPRTWDYRITDLVRTVDGDTFDLRVEKQMDFGFRLIEDKSWATRFRLLGVDAPEARTTDGPAATAFSDAWIRQAIFDDVLRGQTFKTDNFGRWLIDLYRVDTGAHLSDALLAAGLAKPFP